MCNAFWAQKSIHHIRFQFIFHHHRRRIHNFCFRFRSLWLVNLILVFVCLFVSKWNKMLRFNKKIHKKSTSEFRKCNKKETRFVCWCDVENPLLKFVLWKERRRRKKKSKMYKRATRGSNLKKLYLGHTYILTLKDFKGKGNFRDIWRVKVYLEIGLELDKYYQIQE